MRGVELVDGPEVGHGSQSNRGATRGAGEGGAEGLSGGAAGERRGGAGVTILSVEERREGRVSLGVERETGAHAALRTRVPKVFYFVVSAAGKLRGREEGEIRRVVREMCDSRSLYLKFL